MDRKQKNPTKNMIIKVLILPVALIIATVMMILLYALPTEQMKENVTKSLPMYDGGTFSFSNWANGKRYTALSNYTDCIMINTAIYRPTDSAIENAMVAGHATYSEKENGKELVRFVKGEEGYSTKEYTRYWHGYLMYMIPALQIMDVGELKVVGMIIQFFLTMILLFLLGKRSTMLMMLYGIVALFINPVTTVLTFQEADIYCLMMLSMIVILQFNEKLKGGWYFSLFMVNGICVAFFDFLTYPLVAFGIPLVLALLLDKKNTIKGMITQIIKYSLGWMIGYVGMWGGKWVVSSILTGRNMFLEAFERLEWRTHGQGEYTGVLSYGNTLSTIWDAINNLPMILLLFGAGIIVVYYLIKNKNSLSFSTIGLQRSVCFFIIGLFPFAWYYVAMNHSIVHPWMSYRELAITIWATAAIIYTNLAPQKESI